MNPVTRYPAAAAAALLCLSLTACSSEPDRQQTSCQAGSFIRCTCGDGRHGEASCNAQGTGFEACACTDSGACMPGSVAFCACPGNGIGHSVCNAEGSAYGACECAGMQACAPRSLAVCNCGDGKSGTAACRDDGSGYGDCACANPLLCTPRSIAVCACLDGGQGQTVCQEDGSAFGPCDCTNFQVCTPLSLQTCTCDDGTEGRATCNAAGTAFSECACTPVATCIPGTIQACGCPNGTGQMVCGEGGTFGDCLCDARICFPGDLALCDCDEGTGAQACNREGTGYLACQCNSPLACVPGSKAACTCSDGASGQASCNSAGDGFGACDCSGPRCTPGTRKLCTCEGGASGLATCSSDGAGYGVCACNSPCGGLAASGVLHTSQADLSMWGSEVASTVVHRMDSDAADDGCISEAKFTVGASARGCSLALEFGRLPSTYYQSAPSPYGGLRKVTFSADSYCPGFTSGAEGVYSSSPGFLPGWYEGPSEVSDRLVSSACFRSTNIRFADHALTLARADGQLLTLNLKDLTLSGDLSSAGSPSATCFERDRCEAPMYDGGGGWCVAPCAQYEWGCTVNCAAGFHDGGDRTCVAASSCASGYWNGGEGKCIPAGTCTLGYHDDGSGECTMVPGCIPGYHDGGDGNCAPEGECAPTYGHDAYGYCKRWVSVSPPPAPSSGYYYSQPWTSAVRLESGEVLAISSTSAQLFDPTTLTWSSAGTPSTSRVQHQAHAIAQNRVFVLGLPEYNGYGTPATSQAMIFDAATKSWTNTNNMAIADRTDPCSASLADGTVLVVGGHKTEQRAELFDPATKTWKFAGALSRARRGPGCTRLPDGRVLVCGGTTPQQDCSYSGCYTTSCEMFDPATLRWSAAGALKSIIAPPSMAPLGTTSVLVVGPNGEGPLLYDVATGLSSQLSNGPSYGRVALSMAPDRLFVLGSRPAVVETSGTSTVVREIGPLIEAPDYSRAVVLADGRILVFDYDSAQLFIGSL